MIRYAARVSAAAVALGLSVAGAQASAIAVAQTGDAESGRASAGDSPGDRRADFRETRRPRSSGNAGRPNPEVAVEVLSGEQTALAAARMSRGPTRSTPDITDTADGAGIPDGALAERAIQPARRENRRGRPAVDSTPETTAA